jgi:dTMP kinase
MHPNPGPGRFIVVEGLDGAGSTTQVGMLYRRLAESCPAYATYEPSDGPVGLQIRMVLEHRLAVDAATLAALFAADRMDHLYHRDGVGGIVAHLERGVDVITDRYYLSSLAYQGMSLDWQWIWDMHAQCICPDLTLFVDVPVEVCLQRIAAGRGARFDLFENQKALARARQSYLEAIGRLCRMGENIKVIDGDLPPDKVHDAIWSQVEDLA